MRDVCIFAHYDRDDQVDPVVLHYLSALKGCGFETVFVTSSAIAPADIEKVAGYCVDCIVRDNVGHDFGSWSEGLARYRDKIEGRLLLANDSVYGPLYPLKPQIAALTSVRADFYGMVCSLEDVPHLQSWFLLFEPHVVRSEAFADVFCKTPLTRLREVVIAEQELHVTRRLAEAGFSYHALYMPGPRALLGNPTVFLWREIIEKDGIPFLKVSALRDDPVGAFKSGTWRETVGRYDQQVLAMIDAHRHRARHHAAAVPPVWVRLRRRIYRRLLQIDDLGARRKWPQLIRWNSSIFRLIFAWGDWRGRMAVPPGRNSDRLR